MSTGIIPRNPRDLNQSQPPVTHQCETGTSGHDFLNVNGVGDFFPIHNKPQEVSKKLTGVVMSQKWG